MKRRTFKRLRPDRRAEHHHHVYVVLLDSAVARLRKVRTMAPSCVPSRSSVMVEPSQQFGQQSGMFRFV
jgi:hypothetical protein